MCDIRLESYFQRARQNRRCYNPDCGS